MMLHVLDWFFLLFHGSIVLFNLFGWIWARTRLAHLISISLTFLSWVALGPLLGWGVGYCPCTDWHWDVKRALGSGDLPGSYVKYYLDAITGWNWSGDTVDTLVLVSSVAAFLASVVLNVRDWRLRKSTTLAEG